MTMLEYFKLILQKVSFDPTIFKNEFSKAISKLLPEEVVDLKKWCVETFGKNYCDKIDISFSI
jgi:hypothetical protein